MISIERIRRLLDRVRSRPQPPNRFQRMAAAFRARLDRWPPAPAGGRTRIGIVIPPWLESAVPFFSMECAIRLSADAEVSLIWDPSNIHFNRVPAHEVEGIRQCLAQIEKWLPVIDAGKGPGAGEMDRALIETLLHENAVARTMGEQKAGELSERHAASVDEMARHSGRIRALLKSQRFDWLLIPGGVWGVSGIYCRMAAEAGVHVTTYDCGDGIMFLAHDGVAAHFADMSATFQQVLRESASEPAARERMVALARAELATRMEGTDLYRLQPKPAGLAAEETWDILLPLNFRSDSAAMCRQRLFTSVGDWLRQVLTWLQTQPGVTLAIRQHPCEKIEEFRGTDRWGELVAGYRLGERCRFIAAADDVNTYDLLARTRVVLPCTSRVAIEAGIFGKPVILGWETYYEDCGFACKAATVPEYFELVSRALRGELPPPAGAEEAASVAYYLAEKCFPLETGFTPSPNDFVHWVERAPEDLWAAPENALMLEALVTRQPLALLQSRRLAKA